MGQVGRIPWNASEHTSDNMAVSQTSGFALHPDVLASFRYELRSQPKIDLVNNKKRKEKEKLLLMSQNSYSTLICVSNVVHLSLSFILIHHGFLCTERSAFPIRQQISWEKRQYFICLCISNP